MMRSTLSNSTSIFGDATGSPILNPMISPHQQTHKIKKKRNLPGNPDPDAEVIALSPNSLMATNRYVCEVCNKGFQRDQNLQLHRRGHNLPWKLKQKSKTDVRKKVYVCPEPSCVHNHPSRALGDLTGIKKHFCRKHGEKSWRCEKCQKKYAVQSDYKAHIKICGTRDHKCECGSIFTRKDSFNIHKAFCDGFEEGANQNPDPILVQQTMTSPPLSPPPPQNLHSHFIPQNSSPPPPPPPLFHFSTHLSNQPPVAWDPQPQNLNLASNNIMHMINNPNVSNNSNTAPLSTTTLIQAANNTVGTTSISSGANTHSAGYIPSSSLTQLNMDSFDSATYHQGVSPTQHMGFSPPNQLVSTWQESDHATRDFLGLTGGDHGNQGGNARDLLNFVGDDDFPPAIDRDYSIFKLPRFGF